MSKVNEYIDITVDRIEADMFDLVMLQKYLRYCIVGKI